MSDHIFTSASDEWPSHSDEASVISLPNSSSIDENDQSKTQLTTPQEPVSRDVTPESSPASDENINPESNLSYAELLSLTKCFVAKRPNGQVVGNHISWLTKRTTYLHKLFESDPGLSTQAGVGKLTKQLSILKDRLTILLYNVYHTQSCTCCELPEVSHPIWGDLCDWLVECRGDLGILEARLENWDNGRTRRFLPARFPEVGGFQHDFLNKIQTFTNILPPVSTLLLLLSYVAK